MEALSQALIAMNCYSLDSNYSQKVLKKITRAHLVVYFRLEEAAKALLMRSSSLNVEDSELQMALSWAAKRGHYAIMVLLLT